MRQFRMMGKMAMMGWIAVACLVAAATGRAASMTIPAGMTISVRMLDSIDSGRNYAGETFRATVDAPLVVEGKTLVPKGAEAIGRLVSVVQSGRLQGRPMLALELTALNFAGKSLAVQTSAYQESGPSQTKRTAIIAGGGAVLGTVIGAIAGGGILLGSNVGAAAGTIYQGVRGAKQVQIPAESLVIFTLQSPISFDEGL